MSGDALLTSPLKCGKCGPFPWEEAKMTKGPDGRDWAIGHEKCGSALVYELDPEKGPEIVAFTIE